MKIINLSSIANPISISVQNPSRSDYDRFIGLEHYDSGEPVITRFQGTELLTTSAKAFKANDILIARRNVYLKRAGIVFFDGITSGDSIILRLKEDTQKTIGYSREDLIRYIPFMLNSEHFWIYANKHADGMNSKRISKDTLLEYEFELPSIDEMRDISDKLWAAYRLKEAYKKLLVTTDEMVKSQFIEIFYGMETTPVKDYIDDSFPGEWGTEDKDGNGVKVIRTTNFTNSGKLNLADVVTRSIEDRKVVRKQIKKYDTILERSGGTADNPVGRVVLFEEDNLFLCNNFTQVLRFKDVDPRFAFYALYYFYQTNRTAIRSMGSKTTGIQNLNMSKYLEIGIPNASDEDQKAFVTIAEQADKSEFVGCKSQFIEMFGDPMTNTKAWVEFGYIGNYTQIVLGTTPNSKNSSYWNGEIKWITPAEMTEESYYIYDTERHLTEEGLKAANLTLLPCRSVLFSTRAPIGKVGLVGSPMYCNQGFKNFVCGDQLNPVYLYYSLIFKREYLVSLGTGTTFKELSKKAVENLKIAVPPLILQNKFEEIYQQADKSKSVIQKALVYLNDIQSDELGKIA